MKRKQSLFEKLTGSFRMFPNTEEDEDTLLSGEDEERNVPITSDDSSSDVQPDEDGELSIDLYETPKEFILKTVIAGTDKDEIEIDITRSTITVRGSRHNYAVDDGEYLTQELFWGSFSRTVTLPEEIEVDDAEAHESRGVLTITMPKIDHGKQASLKVKTKE
jgi:HSP20 family molecular chaperone IbpA